MRYSIRSGNPDAEVQVGQATYDGENSPEKQRLELEAMRRAIQSQEVKPLYTPAAGSEDADQLIKTRGENAEMMARTTGPDTFEPRDTNQYAYEPVVSVGPDDVMTSGIEKLIKGIQEKVSSRGEKTRDFVDSLKQRDKGPSWLTDSESNLGGDRVDVLSGDLKEGQKVYLTATHDNRIPPGNYTIERDYDKNQLTNREETNWYAVDAAGNRYKYKRDVVRGADNSDFMDNVMNPLSWFS